MTTFNQLFAEEIYVKGKPFTGLDNSTLTTISNTTNNVTNINAIISGLFGGQPIDDVSIVQKTQTRAPDLNDDITENWNIGALWITVDQAYICLDNASNSAIWIPVLLDDDHIAIDSSYSSFKIETALNLKADKTEVDLQLAQKADITDLDFKTDKTFTEHELSLKADKTALNLKADKTELNTAITQKDNQLVSIMEIINLKADTSAVNLKADKMNTYTKPEISDLLDLKSDLTDIDELQNQMTDSLLKSLQVYPTFSVLSGSRELSLSFRGVEISSSSILPGYFATISAHKAFNKVISGNEMGWLSSNAFYGSGFTTYLNGDTLSVKTGQTMTEYQLYRTQVNGSNVGRQWISIDCGEAKVFSGFRLYYRGVASKNLKDYQVVGSNDNTNFTSLYSTNNEDIGRIIVKPLSYETAYRYYRIVVHDIMDSNGANHHCNLQEWVLLQKSDVTETSLLVDVLNTWIKNGNLSLSGVSYTTDPIRENW